MKIFLAEISNFGTLQLYILVNDKNYQCYFIGDIYHYHLFSIIGVKTLPLVGIRDAS